MLLRQYMPVASDSAGGTKRNGDPPQRPSTVVAWAVWLHVARGPDPALRKRNADDHSC